MRKILTSLVLLVALSCPVAGSSFEQSSRGSGQVVKQNIRQLEGHEWLAALLLASSFWCGVLGGRFGGAKAKFGRMPTWREYWSYDPYSERGSAKYVLMSMHAGAFSSVVAGALLSFT